MSRKLRFDPSNLVLILLALLLKLFSLFPAAVERYYTQMLYPPVSLLLRRLLGWIPVSIGDILYAAAILYLLWHLVLTTRRFRKVKERKGLLGETLVRLVRASLGIYILFELLWGLNYSRQGISAQLGLEALPYSEGELGVVASALQDRLAETAPLVDTVARLQLHQHNRLRAAGLAAYERAQKKYGFLKYKAPSIKPSLFTAIGKFIGFTGYYNPFTAEAQIKTDIPVFLKPFVATHEMAHQLGYAKESEANFVAFLTCRESLNNEVRYAVYFELFLYTLSDMRRADSAAARRYRNAAPLQVQRDMEALADYLERIQNPIEPYMARIYDAYLRWNKQPKGRLSYNEVLSWLVAYEKKYGRKAI